MTNTMALQMPSSYVLMNVEEMTYVEGGAWQTYTGVAARNKLAGMILVTTGLAVSSYQLGALSLALAPTGLGMFASLCYAIGAAWCAALTCVNALMTGTAAYYYFKCGGFQVNTVTVPVISETFYAGIRGV